MRAGLILWLGLEVERDLPRAAALMREACDLGEAVDARRLR